jgi:ethanolamine utilization protein EutA
MSFSDNGESKSGGRTFFSSAGRSLEGEDEIELASVGVDIGSSTSHLVFSRLLLERMDNRYVVVERELVHESDILLTPHAADGSIDTAALGAFITRQYELANITPSGIDTGALILTGVAVRRRNARAIGELFAADAGKFVSVSAGDGLEATLAAFGSGAVGQSIRARGAWVMNIDIGGGTAKIALCRDGVIRDVTAIDIGARIIALDEHGRIARLELAGERFASELGLALKMGAPPPQGAMAALAERMAERLFEAVSKQELSGETAALLRLPPLREAIRPDIVTFSGGVSEFIYGRETRSFGDLGLQLGEALRRRIADWALNIVPPVEGIRATVVGAAQYTVQVSGSTIFVHPMNILPLRNVAVIVPDLDLEAEALSIDAIAASVDRSLRRLDLREGDRPVALCYRWLGSATFARLDSFCRGIVAGLAFVSAKGQPLVLVGDGDVGGLVGLHMLEELKPDVPIVSIDGITMKEFDFVDIGALLAASGAVPVVIKSLVFPTSAALGNPTLASTELAPAETTRGRKIL